MERNQKDVFMTMREFEQIPQKQLTKENFFQKPDYQTVHTLFFYEGRQIFLTPDGRDTWI